MQPPPSPPQDSAASGLTLPPVRAVGLFRPFRWFALGWRDFVRAFAPSVLHGVMVAAAGWMILGLAVRFWPLVPGAVSGFVLVGPILATGLYELSRRIALGERPALGQVIAAWRRGTRPLVWLGLILMVAGTLWVLVSVVLIALFVKAPITGLASFVRYVVLSEGSNLFPAWVALGGIGAALVFAVTVVSAPLLLDRDVDLLSAIVTSVRAVSESPHAMALWAILIVVATGISVATLMLGFIVLVPVIGHATWHAYRDVVDAAALPPRS
jgi:uncharacterized membrane protein